MQLQRAAEAQAEQENQPAKVNCSRVLARGQSLAHDEGNPFVSPFPVAKEADTKEKCEVNIGHSVSLNNGWDIAQAAVELGTEKGEKQSETPQRKQEPLVDLEDADDQRPKKQGYNAYLDMLKDINFSGEVERSLYYTANKS